MPAHTCWQPAGRTHTCARGTPVHKRASSGLCVGPRSQGPGECGETRVTVLRSWRGECRDLREGGGQGAGARAAEETRGGQAAGARKPLSADDTARHPPLPPPQPRAAAGAGSGGVPRRRDRAPGPAPESKSESAGPPARRRGRHGRSPTPRHSSGPAAAAWCWAQLPPGRLAGTLQTQLAEGPARWMSG